MHLKFFAAFGVSACLLLAPVPSMAAGCCGQDMKCCDNAAMKDMKDMKCCDKDTDAVAVLMSIAQNPQINPAPPVRQATDVWFMRPVVINHRVLQGHYVIEHDNDRMAKGDPCTYIYAFNDRTKPVVTFHCVHLDRPRMGQNTVVLTSTSDGWQNLSEFQFAGETASHGNPSVR